MSSAGSAPRGQSELSESLPRVASVVPLVSVWRVDRPFDYLVPDELADDVRPGCIVGVTFGNRRVRCVVRRVTRERPERDLASIDRIVVPEPLAGPPLEELLDWEARRYVTTLAASWSRVVPPRVRAKRVEATPRTVEQPTAGDVGELQGFDDLIAALRDGSSGTWLVRPDLSVPRARLVSALASAPPEGSVLVGVPEVALGSAILDALKEGHPGLVRTDVGVSESLRSSASFRLTHGRAIGAGGRSIVHAPAPDLALLLLDEEHHASYKEDRSPRYDARQSALERTRLQNCACVFISPTPSVEAGFKAQTGEWGSVSPSKRAEREARPVVEVVPPDPKRAVTAELFSRMRDTLNAGGKAAVLVPSAGFARTLWCSNCRRSLRCPRCESGLSVRDESSLTVACPVCTFEGTAPAKCPSCGASAWRFLGAGSRRHAEQLAKAFPRARVHRVDPDAVEAPADPPDIYVTTWIGTKPILRPDVGLVAVLDADPLLRRPEFRAAENAYQALQAMSEWAGPAEAGGRLVIQCADAGHHAVQAVVRASYDYFLERELEMRKDLSYPPFSELVRIWADPKNEESIAKAVAVARQAGGRVLGPVPARRGGRRILEALVKCPEARVIADELRNLMSAGERSFSVDVDPR